MGRLPTALILITFHFLIGEIVTENKTEISEPAICSYKKCVKKCCPETYHVLFQRRKCAPNNGTVVDISLPLYNDNKETVGKTFEEVFYLNPKPPAFKNRTFRSKKLLEAVSFGFNVYLSESGTVFLEMPNAYERWTPKALGSYCMDYHVVEQEDNSSYIAIGVWTRLDNSDDQVTRGNTFFTAGMIISCVFLVLVLMVYLALPQLRNLGGLVLMAYTVSLLFAFISLMVVQRGNHSIPGCIGLTLTVYFCFLSSFCWMNTMSYDIWWTFRGYAKARPIHRRGEKFKFCMYCLYAWGVPAAMTIALAVLLQVDLKHWPWFIKPEIPSKGCFLEDGEKLVYLYIPMLILIMFNWLFFILTAFNIWRLSRGTAVLDSAAAGNPAAHRKQRHRLLVYLKLSILMGLNWVLEVASYFKPDLNVWYITDAYNLLIGLAIFLIFVCKKKIFKQLKKRYYPTTNWGPFARAGSRSSSVTEASNLSQDMAAIQINPDPKPKVFF